MMTAGRLKRINFSMCSLHYIPTKAMSSEPRIAGLLYIRRHLREEPFRYRGNCGGGRLPARLHSGVRESATSGERTAVGTTGERRRRRSRLSGVGVPSGKPKELRAGGGHCQQVL